MSNEPKCFDCGGTDCELVGKDNGMVMIKHEISAVNCGCGWHPSCVPHLTQAMTCPSCLYTELVKFGYYHLCPHCGWSTKPNLTEGTRDDS